MSILNTVGIFASACDNSTNSTSADPSSNDTLPLISAGIGVGMISLGLCYLLLLFKRANSNRTPTNSDATRAPTNSVATDAHNDETGGVSLTSYEKGPGP